MDIEARLVRAQLEVYVGRREECCSKSVSVARYGKYEVRLLRPVQGSSLDPFIFWLELFDQDRGISLDSGSAEYFEKALALADQLISQAEQLSKT